MAEAWQPGLRVGAGAMSPLVAGTQGMWGRAAVGQGAGKTGVTPDQRR